MQVRKRIGLVVLAVMLGLCGGCSLSPINGLLNGDRDSVVHLPAVRSKHAAPVVEPVEKEVVTEEDAVRVWGKPLASPATRP